MDRLTRRGVLHWVIALCVAGWPVRGAAGQDHYVLGTTFGTTHRVYRISASGEVSIHQELNAGHRVEDIAVDRGGRFVWMIKGGGPSPIYRISREFHLSLGGQVTASSPEWKVWRPALLTPDTSDLIVTALAPTTGDFRVSLEYSSLSNSLATSAVHAVWDVSDIPEAQPQVGVVSPFDRYTLFTDSGVIHLDPTALEFALPQQASGYSRGFPAAGFDGRVICTVSHADPGPEFGVNVVQGDGQGTVLLSDSIPDIPGVSNRHGAVVHPGGRFAYLYGLGGLPTIEVNPASGLIQGVLETAPAPSTNAAAISPDGTMFFLATNRFNGIASMIPYRVNADGTLTQLNAGLQVPFSTADLEFLPPKTPPSLPGDANVDGLVDAADVVTVVEMV
ncbi:MAG: hypothetical protein HUU25_14595, partial [Candidatus Sumerlaeia bacterium]|nr:hypothetical protein [Candidatus Sumerlaeia bacterium]